MSYSGAEEQRIAFLTSVFEISGLHFVGFIPIGTANNEAKSTRVKSTMKIPNMAVMLSIIPILESLKN